MLDFEGDLSCERPTLVDDGFLDVERFLNFISTQAIVFNMEVEAYPKPADVEKDGTRHVDHSMDLQQGQWQIIYASSDALRNHP